MHVFVYKTFYCIYHYFTTLDFQSFHDWSKAAITLKVLDTLKTSVSQNYRFLATWVVCLRASASEPGKWYEL